MRESDHPGLIYELTPGARRTVWGVDFKINSAGMRDREYDLEKTDGVYRIVVLGDSIAAGHRLPVEATFSNQLEEMFRQRAMNVEVLNLGVDGYDTTQEVAALEHKGLRFKPDEVILAYCMNDIGNQSGSLVYIGKVRQYGVPVYDLRSLQFLTFQLNRIFGAGRSPAIAKTNGQPSTSDDAFVTERARRIGDYVRSKAYPRNTWGSLDWYAEPARIEKLRIAFARLKDLSETHGFKVTVLILPYLADPAAAHDDAYEIAAREARIAGFQVVEPLEAFKAEGLANLRRGPGDPIHPNAQGHAVIAETLFEAHDQRRH